MTSELEGKIHTSLRLLSEHASEEDVENFISAASLYVDPVDRQNADAVLTVSSSANIGVYENVRKKSVIMSDALKELMKDVIQEENQKAVDTSLIAVIKNLMKKNGWDASEAMESMGISESDQIRYAARL